MENSAKTFDVPILLQIFRKPDTAMKVVEALRKVRPTQLYISQDAPRMDRPEEIRLCKETREQVMSGIDWPCDIKTYFRKENGGLRYGYADQIDWFFREVEEGILLEDDSIAEPSFFWYCAELLERYRDNPEVMVIDGFYIRDLFPELKIPESYRFSRVPMCYGWATWRRVWNLYDVHMKDFNQLIDTPKLRNHFGDEGAYQRWRMVWKQCVEEDLDVWDAPLVYMVAKYNGLCAAPGRNMVTNLGFTPGATHNYTTNIFVNRPSYPMEFPLVHPQKIEADAKADLYLYRYYFYIDQKPLYRYILRPVRNMFPNAYQQIKKLLKR